MHRIPVLIPLPSGASMNYHENLHQALRLCEPESILYALLSSYSVWVLKVSEHLFKPYSEWTLLQTRWWNRETWCLEKIRPCLWLTSLELDLQMIWWRSLLQMRIPGSRTIMPSVPTKRTLIVLVWVWNHLVFQTKTMVAYNQW